MNFRKRNGQALVEFALVLPLLFLLIINVVNFGAFFFAAVGVANAARAGADYLMLGPASAANSSLPTLSQVSTVVQDDLASLPEREHWRGGLPLWHRDTIFPEDFARLAQHRFDVLISHEAPSSHRFGFAAIDRLAEVTSARLIVHGHHHEAYTARIAGNIDVRGLAVAETWVLELA